jgi:hypothetical protein
MRRAKAVEAVSRRGFLGALGAAGAIAPGVCALGVGSVANAQTVTTTTLREDRFGRMFRDLPPFATPSAQLTAALTELGKPGGIMDAKDPRQGNRSRVRCARRCYRAAILQTWVCSARTWIARPRYGFTSCARHT